MAHPLSERIEQLRARLDRRRMATAAGWVIAVVAMVALALMLLDYGYRSHDRGLRWLALAALVAAFAIAGRKWLAPIIFQPLTTFNVAQRVQSHFPRLGSRLASALEFIDQSTDDPQAGSTALRRAVVVDTAAKLNHLDIEAIVDPVPMRRALLACVISLQALATFFIADPASWCTAAGRLAAPWANIDWPRKHQLVVNDAPQRIARGQIFEATITDENGPLPNDLQVTYRAVGQATFGPERLDTQTTPIVGHVGVVRRENVQQSFAFRVTGGDDQSMAWTEVEVVDPPVVELVSLTATPPAYSGLPAGETDPHLHVLAGTQLELVAQSPSTLKGASVVIGAGQQQRIIPADISKADDTHRVTIPAGRWLAQSSEEATRGRSYFLRVESQQSLTGVTQPRPLRVVTDTPPSVAWQKPSSDLFVTQRAVVPLTADVSDNLAIQWVDLVAHQDAETSTTGASNSSDHANPDKKNGEPLHRQRIATGPAAPPAQPEGLATDGQSQQVTLDWSLEPLRLSPGDQLLVSIEAADYRPGVGRTPTTRRITIITLAEIDARIADAASALTRDLERALTLQRSARDATGQLAIEQRNAATVDGKTVDRLSTLGYEQRQVASALTGDDRGALQRASDLQAELQTNQLDRPELVSELDRIRQQLARLDQAPLPTAQRALTDARRAATRLAESDANQAADQTILDPLAEVQSSQDETVQTLEALVDSLARWSDLQRFTREVSDLEQKQQQLATETQAETTQANSARDQSARRAEREQLATRQAELARRFDRLQRGMREQVEQMQQDSPAQQNVADALAESQDRATGGKMQDATRRLNRGQMGRAATEQLAAAKDLQQMLDILRGRASTDPRKLADQLRAAEEQLSELRAQAAQEAASASDERQADRRERLADRADRLSRQLNRLQAPEAGQSTQQGGDQMSQSAAQSNPSEAAQSMRNADDQLQQAQQQLAQRINELENQIVESVLKKLAGKIDSYIARQRQVLEGTILANDSPEDDRTASAKRLAGDQRSLEAIIAAAAEELATRAVFEMALTSASQDMGSAAGGLEASQTGPKTQQAEHAALTRLQHVAQVLKPDPNLPPPDSQQNDGGGQGGDGKQPPPPPIDVAELKMLRLMQLSLNAQTRQLEADTAAQLLPQDESRAIAQRLAGEQNRLADLVRELASRNNAGTPGSQTQPLETN